MKVILLQDVARVGRKGEVKDVPDGHARNMLIPRQMVAPATPANLKEHAAREAGKAASTEAHQSELNAVAQKLDGTTLTLAARANEKGHLFKSVKAADVAARVSETTGSIDAAHLAFPEPIKAVGEYEVEVIGTPHRFTLAVTAAQ